MTQFSANLGFLWSDLKLPDAIRAAKAAGFDAVECHWPYDVDTAEINSALLETNMEMLGLNTRRGNSEDGDNGLCALVGREGEARAAIDEAIDYAVAINARHIHVMAGNAFGPGAYACFIKNLGYAGERAIQHNKTIVIEPLNHYDMPGYFLSTTEQAKTIIEALDRPNIKLMFDCYHVQLMDGEVIKQLKELYPIIGHIQFASVPDRGTPDHGQLDYQHVFDVIEELGYDSPLGAEYRSPLKTEDTLGWMEKFASG